MNLNKWICCTLLCGFLYFSGFSQDSSSALQWKVSGKKTGTSQYELTFSLNKTDGWQLYAPNQLLNEVATTELQFPDTAVQVVGAIKDSGNVKTTPSQLFEGTSVKVYEGVTTWKQVIKIIGKVPATLKATLLYTYGKGEEFYSGTPYEFIVPLEGGVASDSRIKINSIDINNPVNPCGDEGTNKSLFTIFLLGFLGGLIALLTPCVFPMIPVTVTFFTKKSDSKGKGILNAILYGLFIFLIYVLITVPFHVAHIRPEVFNNISTNVWLNLLFFAIFIFFALSFFGLFEITLPSGLANKMDSKSGIGNIGGIFFMATTLAIVSFSCTGPIFGTLLAGVADGGAWPLTVGAAGFGLALGLPFALFAFFPHWLSSLPKSGGWMTDVKIVLAFVELALAVKFLSNADLVMQFGFLKRELFIGLWVLIGFLVVLYLSGKLRFSHSSPVKKFSVTRIAFIAIFSLFTLYILPGVTNTKWANLSLISGFPPPLCYSLYKHPVNCERNIEPIKNDYEAALRIAKEQNKPILIDFTGWACVNCRRMEENIWTDPDVARMMKNDFVVVSLFVDERKKLPLSDQIQVPTKTGEKTLVTVGDKWATFQSENFNAVAQPQYAIISPDEKALTKTKTYTDNAEKFADWLQCGLKTMQAGGQPSSK